METPKRKYATDNTNIDIGEFNGVDVGFAHGGFVMHGAHYDGTNEQGFGYVIDTEFIIKFMDAFGAKRLQECNGKLIFVEHNNNKIHRLIPVRKNRYEREFDIINWLNKNKK